MGDEYDDLYGDLYGDDAQASAGADASKGGSSAAVPSSTTSAATGSAQPPAGSPSSTEVRDPRARPASSMPAPVQQPYQPQQQQQPPYQPQQQQQQQSHPGSSLPPTAHDKYKMAELPDAAKMFIGGLNWDTTDESLRDYFQKFGNVTHSTIMRDSDTGRSRGFAFLTFEDPASVDTVLQTEHYLDGKTIDPKRAIPKSEGNKTDKIFVRNIPVNCNQERFRQFWRQFPGLADATLMMDRETGKHRGFGFVNYESTEAVDRVLASGPHVMDGQQMEVKRAQQRPENQQRRFGAGGQQQQQQWGPYGARAGGGGGQGGQQPPGGAAGAAAGGFDPNAMASFFQQMGWGAFNPMMMGMGMPMMNPMMMPGDGQQAAAGAAGGAMDPAQMMAAMQQMPMMGGASNTWTNPAQQGAPSAAGQSSRGGRGGGRGGSASGRGGFNLPSGPAAMRGQDSGAGPHRSRGGGQNYHPYSRQ